MNTSSRLGYHSVYPTCPLQSAWGSAVLPVQNPPWPRVQPFIPGGQAGSYYWHYDSAGQPRVSPVPAMNRYALFWDPVMQKPQDRYQSQMWGEPKREGFDASKRSIPGHAVAIPLSKELKTPNVSRAKLAEKNIWRDTLLRFLGYTNEVAVAWKGWLQEKLRGCSRLSADKIVKGSYWVASLYSAADALTIGVKTYKDRAYQQQKHRIRAAAIEAAGGGIFQALASVWIPAEVIKKVYKGIHYAMGNRTVAGALMNFSPKTKVIMPALLASATIPLLVKPIDWGVEALLKLVYWPLMKSLFGHEHQKH